MLSKTSNKRSTLFSAFIGWINHVIYTLKYSARSAMSSHVQNQTSKWHNPIWWWLGKRCVTSLPYFNLLHLCHPCLREASTFTVRGDKRIGRKYNKVVYREYTSAEFTERKTRTAPESHLGVLGPILHAEVGDTIEVTFKNLASGKFSMHPHGLFYRYARGAMRTLKQLQQVLCAIQVLCLLLPTKRDHTQPKSQKMPHKSAQSPR